MVGFLGMVALFAFLNRVDIAKGEHPAVLQAVIGRVVKDLQDLSVQVAHTPTPKVGVICCRHGHYFVCRCQRQLEGAEG